MADGDGALKGKIALVTGASRGIGRAIASHLAREGAHIAATGRDGEALDALVSEVAAGGGVARAFIADLLAEDAPAALVRAVVDAFGGIDILVNNAGATKRGDFLTQPESDWADGFGLKFFAAVRLTRAAWPGLQKRAGAVLNIIGIGARTPHSDVAVGASVNAALAAFTKTIAARGVVDGVRVNAIHPGSVRTGRLQRRLDVIAERSGGDLAAAEAEMRREAKITRFGEPSDIAALAAFILSREGEWLHGSLIDMDGGETKAL
jgi:3-oxoacyl-[acyl-carrier protein] reductase